MANSWERGPAFRMPKHFLLVFIEIFAALLVMVATVAARLFSEDRS
jgi:hypothetical protein